MSEDIYKRNTMPHNSPGLLSRPRLNSILSKAVKESLITVSAGAGYGKTQTISMFLNDSNFRVAWLQLSKLDNYPDRFWKEFIYALSLVGDETAEILKMLNFPETLREFDQFLRVFAKEIYKDNPFIFVFDDFHFIQNKLIIDFVENLVAANIEDFCIILLSRAKIPFQTNSKYHLTEKDLRFTIDRTDEYFKSLGISLTESELEKIDAYTEGWPLALYLVGLELKKESNQWVDPLPGTKLVVIKMIEEDIFATYSPLVKNLLTKFSLLDEFPAGLIQQLSGEHIDTIMDIINTNMFIAFNPYNRRYHFHQIFLDFLQERQIYLDPKEIQEVYITAAQWYDAKGFKVDAMIYYERCSCYNELWEIIRLWTPKRHPRSTASHVIRLLEGFPKPFIQKHPMIRIIRASFQLNNLELKAAAEDLLDLIDEQKRLPESQAVLGEAYIVLALIRQTQKEHSYVKYYKMADACLPKGSIRDYSQIKIIDSNNAINPNNLQNKEVERLQNDLFEAMPYASRVMHGLGYGVEYLAKAEVAYFKGNMEMAQNNAFEAIYRAQQKKQYDIVCNAYFLLMKVTAAKGNYDATIAHLQQLKVFAQSDEHLSIMDIAEGWFLIKMGHSENIARWLLDDSLNATIHPPISVGRDRLIRAYYFLKEGQYDELLAFSEQLDDLYQEKGLWLDLLSIRTMKALALYYTGNISLCSEILQSLYELVNEKNFIMPFIEMGTSMCSMIDSVRKATNYNIPEEWLHNIYAKSSTYAKRQSFYKKKYNLKNGQQTTEHFQLSRREKEILIDLCQGLTREEIAESLYLSVHTVKSTLQKIYNKLGAVNRADAVRIATQTKII